MGKRKESNHELEQYSQGRFLTRFSEWVLNALADEDYTFDFEVRPRRGILASHTDDTWDTVTQSPFYVQLKAHENFENTDSVYHDFEVDFLTEDCLRVSVPVVLMVYERSEDEFSWCVLQNYCWDVLDVKNEGWRKQTEVRVRIDRNTNPGFVDRSNLRDAVGVARRRISVRKYISLVRRGSFAAVPETELASAEDVIAYKSEMVIDALEFAEAGDRERARSRLMEVYQMPGEDEARLEARRHLLELQEIDEPTLAFTKMRFALEGRYWCKEFDREELLAEFKEHYNDALAYVDEYVVGATCVGAETSVPFQVLEVLQRGSAEHGDIGYVARVDDTGLSDRDAMAIGENGQFEIVESGKGKQPSEDACAEREHAFEVGDRQQSLAYSNCSECSLSYEVINQWLGHDVPEICEECESVSYEIKGVLTDGSPPSVRLLCPTCR